MPLQVEIANAEKIQETFDLAAETEGVVSYSLCVFAQYCNRSFYLLLDPSALVCCFILFLLYVFMTKIKFIDQAYTVSARLLVYVLRMMTEIYNGHKG